MTKNEKRLRRIIAVLVEQLGEIRYPKRHRLDKRAVEEGLAIAWQEWSSGRVPVPDTWMREIHA